MTGDILDEINKWPEQERARAYATIAEIEEQVGGAGWGGVGDRGAGGPAASRGILGLAQRATTEAGGLKLPCARACMLPRP